MKESIAKKDIVYCSIVKIENNSSIIVIKNEVGFLMGTKFINKDLEKYNLLKKDCYKDYNYLYNNIGNFFAAPPIFLYPEDKKVISIFEARELVEEKNKQLELTGTITIGEKVKKKNFFKKNIDKR